MNFFFMMIVETIFSQNYKNNKDCRRRSHLWPDRGYSVAVFPLYLSENKPFLSVFFLYLHKYYLLKIK